MPAAKHLLSEGRQLVQKTYAYWHTHGVKALARHAVDVLRAGPPVSQPPEGARAASRRSCSEHLAALPTYRIPRTRPRLNLVVESLEPTSPTGPAATALLLCALLAEKTASDLRIITRERGVDELQFARFMQQVGLPVAEHLEFCHAPASSRPDQAVLDVGSNELFVTTSFTSTWCARQTLPASQIVYLVQEDERALYPRSDERLLCSEVLGSPGITYLVHSQRLFNELVQSGLTNLMQQGMWFEPAFPRELFFADPAAVAPAKRQFLFYVPPAGSDLLYQRGVAAIQQALDLGVLRPACWEVHFIGTHRSPIVFSLGVQPKYHEPPSWSAYAALLRKMDLGLFLLHAPHPSYTPFDLAASGAVVISNCLGSKQAAAEYSRNMLHAEPRVDALTEALASGVQLAEDDPRRRENFRQDRLQRDWRMSFAQALGALSRKLPQG